MAATFEATGEQACDCCDVPAYHFENIGQLRRFLDTPGHDTHVDIDVADVPGEPYGMVFVTAGEAEGWLEQYLETVAAAFAQEYGRRPPATMLP